MAAVVQELRWQQRRFLIRSRSDASSTRRHLLPVTEEVQGSMNEAQNQPPIGFGQILETFCLLTMKARLVVHGDCWRQNAD
jgi:hypothetical protein